MRQIAEGLIYSIELNTVVYSNEFILNTGMDLTKVAGMLGNYAVYISDDERDVLYARSSGISIYDECVKQFNYSLLGFIDLDRDIELLKDKHPDFINAIEEEYEYVSKNEHNLLLLRIAFLLKRRLDKTSSNVYLMRGSAVSSYIFYAIGLNKVNPYRFGLDYKDFWND